MKHFGVEKFKGLLFACTLAVAVEFLMTLTDSVVGGHLLGEQALAGISMANPQTSLVTFLSMLLGAGTAINFSREVGRFDAARARQFFSQGIWSVLLLGSALLAVFWLGREAFFSFMNPTAEIRAHATAYWNGSMPLAVTTPLCVVLLECVQADGGSRLCMVASVVQLAVNVAGAFLLCRFGAGAAGLSVATVVANLCGALVLACHFRSATNTLSLVRHFSFRDLLHVAKTSLGDAASMLGTTVFALVLTKFMLARFGSEVMPAVAVALLTFEMSVALDGVSSAISPVVGVYFGEGNTRSIRDVMRAAVRVSFLEGVFFAVLFGLFPGLVVSMCGIDDATVIPCAKTAVRCVACSFPFTALVALFNSYYLFVEREGLSAGLTFFKYLFCDIPLLIVGGMLFGYTGAFVGIAFAPYVALGGVALFLAVRYGRTMVMLMLPRDREARLHVFDLTLEPQQIVDTSEAVAETLKAAGKGGVANRAALIVEEAFMVVRDRNKGRRILGEVTLDLNDDVRLILRDDGEIFDITDADAAAVSLRAYLVATLMANQRYRRNLTTSGFNRNIFRL
ncbi:MAG: hypothetical protein MJ240_05800 [Kiritimatiellae bacterium]|nr:hypothetical protein [Kiritimatiellia bacterium]